MSCVISCLACLLCLFLVCDPRRESCTRSSEGSSCLTSRVWLRERDPSVKPSCSSHSHSAPCLILVQCGASVDSISTHMDTHKYTRRARTHSIRTKHSVTSSPPIWGVWAAKRRCRPLPRPMAPLPSEVKLYHVLRQAAVATHPCCEPWEIRFAVNGVCLLLASAWCRPRCPHTPRAPHAAGGRQLRCQSCTI
jgi:hypothetical protein